MSLEVEHLRVIKETSLKKKHGNGNVLQGTGAGPIILSSTTPPLQRASLIRITPWASPPAR
ncbi:unnamed protein product, partial [Nesidiocoris tenuis]